MKQIALVLALLALAACGADGAPTPPAKPGLSVSGQVKVGVAAGG